MFRDLVDEKFAFLRTKYGFALARSDEHSVEYASPSLTVLIGWHKGEVDVCLCVRLESDVFRPQVSRMFSLEEIARRVDPQLLRKAPTSSSYVTNEAEATAALASKAKTTKACCDPILRGDLTVLEAITRTRSGTSRS